MHCAVPATSFRRPRLAARPLAGWRAVLLCLMIALLPVRGWAWAGMGTQSTAWALAASASSTVTPAPNTPPCHAHDAGQVADQATPGALGTPADDTAVQGSDNTADGQAPHASHHGCTQCDLCHAGVLPPAVAAWPQARPPHHAPGWFPAPDTGRQGTDGLFRPPRG